MGISKAGGAGLVILFLVGAAAGGVGGWMLGTHVLLNAWVQEQAGDVQGHIAMLRSLRAGNTGEALELQESRLDDDLVVLEPEGYRLQEQVRAQMNGALRAAKQYRAEHPRTSRRAGVDEMVRRVLAKETP